MRSPVCFLLRFFAARRVEFPFLVKLAVLLCVPSISLGPALGAQTLVRDTGAPNVQGNTDVTNGMHYLLQNDDLVMLQVNKGGGNTISTSFVTIDTADSKASGTPQTSTINSTDPSGAFDPTGVLAAQGIGRMYNTKSDIVAVLNEGDDAGGKDWQLTLMDPLAHFQYQLALSASFRPHDQVYTQVVMGDFNGDGLSDPLVFYAAVNGNPRAEWGMKVLTAADPKTEAAPTEGPEMYGNTEPVPVTGGIVVGDFNNDGIDEIAALLTDYKTIAFYSVDPKTLTIQPMKDSNGQAITVALPYVMVAGQVTLAAGRFRGLPDATTGRTNADLVAVGQISGQTYGYSVIPIKITPQSGGTFTAQVVTQPNSQQQFFRFPDRHGSYGVMAQTASLVSWPQQTFQQLVIGIQTNDGAGYIDIGSFEPDNNLDTFNWNSDTELENVQTQLISMQVGNFDNLNSDGTHNPAWQIETYTIELNPLFLTPHIRIFDVNVPSPFPPPPGQSPTDWLKQHKDSDISSGIGDLNSMILGVVMPGDMQGRSLRLGAPTIVRIPLQIQPDIVLAIPPMHADWIAPGVPQLLNQTGCTDQNTPCLVNLTVLPSLVNNMPGFSTSLDFTATSSSEAKHASTTSWGIAVSDTSKVSATFGDYLSESSVTIKNTTKYAHDHTVKNTYDKYAGQTQTLKATTGFADHLFFTTKAMNVYYYPVLGSAVCPSDNPNCSDSQKSPTYVDFSVPDQVTTSDVDGTEQEWYQPVHEPGNIFSYPWSKAQLQAEFTDQLDYLTNTPAPCKATDSSTQNYSSSWTNGSSNGSSTGSSDSFSDDLSMSYSASAGVAGIDAASFKNTLDIAGSTSLNTLNETVSSLSVSRGITVNKPAFNQNVAQCCTYAYGGYIFGMKNTKNPASEDACQSGQTTGCAAVNDPDGKAVDIASTGPLFMGFVADPLSSQNPNTELGCAGNGNWWGLVYNKPDVGVNHPARWAWSVSRLSVSFNNADQTTPVLDQPFYQMKGFFITKPSSTGGAGPNLADAKAGDQLTLTARVYNYSLVSTPAPVHVRFYGQLFCRSGSNEASCTNGKTPCASYALCGDSFPIGGGDVVISSIPGYETSSQPNWTTASVNFDTTPYANSYMVFWVVVWMENGGSLVAEMPDHGLTSIPAASLKQITDVPIEAHSNNVGMYGAYRPFFIAPADTGVGGTQSNGSLQSITLSTSPQIPLDQRTKLMSSLQATGGPVNSVHIAYYDGDPAKNGTLLDVQSIQHMDPGVPYVHRTFFTPGTCGAHTLYACAWLSDSPEIRASFTTNVTTQPANMVQTLISSTQSAGITDPKLGSTVLALLNTALQQFQQGQPSAGAATLGSYIQQLSAATGSGISPGSANQLISQANAILGCSPLGFSLSFSPISATVNAGHIATYAMAITPSGGFNGTVSLSCTGAPPGTPCAISPQSIVLNGSVTATGTVTIITYAQSGAVLGAGMAAPPPSKGGRIQWLVIFILTVLVTAWFRRKRLRYTVLGSVIVLAFLLNGCGSSTLPPATPAGTYQITVNASSGAMTQNATLTLIVK